jgi:iron complex outermembrane recepter protein
MSSIKTTSPLPIPQRAGLTALSVAVALACADPAMAQGQLMLEEIIVTAQKREQNMQDVPISIVAASGERLIQTGVSNLTDLGMISSGLSITDSNAYVFPIIRGVGSFIQGSSTNSSVAVYLDGVYVPRMTSTSMEMDNVQSVEVLKGPQVTLYGRNATAGSINIITATARPGDELSGSISATYGEYEQKRITGTVATGLGDKFAIHASGYWVERDGYVEQLADYNLDVTRDGELREAKCGDDLDSLCEYGGQVKLTYAPTERLDFTLAVRFSDFNDTLSSGGRQVSPDTAIAALESGALPLPPPPQPYQFATKYGTAYGHYNRRRGDDLAYTLTVGYETDKHSFTSLSSYYESSSHTSTDLFSANVPTAGFNGVQPTTNLQQEFYVRSNYDGALNWLLGGNYFHEESDNTVKLDQILGSWVLTSQVAENENDAYAVYGELYYALTEKITLTGGLRYTDEQVEATAVFDLFGMVPPGTTQHESDDEVTYRVVADYSTDWGMMYASVSSGFKSGGINATNLAGEPFDSEKITAYEVGVKSTLMDGRLRLNSSAFYYDFTDIQAGIVGGPTGGAQYFLNGDEADLSGIEMDFDAAITEGLMLWGGVTYLIDNEYSDFDVAGDPNVGIPPVSVSGNKMVGASEFSAVLGLLYDYSLGDSGRIALSTNIAYEGGYYTNIENSLGTGGLDSDANFTLWNARASYIFPSDKLELAVWVNNITDEEYTRGGLAALNNATILSQDGKPQEVGATLTYRF